MSGLGMGGAPSMMRVDAWQLAVAPLDMRCGMDSILARVVAVFGCAQPHVAYAFANARASRMKVLLHDGFGLWLCARRLHQGSLAMATRGRAHRQPERPAVERAHGGPALAQIGTRR